MDNKQDLITKKRKILFVGDLRTANNYGAIATTETLTKFLLEYSSDSEIKYIDYRSFFPPTPIEGWPDYFNQKIKNRRIDILKKQSIKTIVKNSLPLFIIKIIQSKRYNKKISFDFVPYRYDLYEDYYKKVQKGEILQYERTLIEWADLVYINGEGNIVNGTDQYGKYRKGGLYVLYIAWLAKVKYQKTTCIVNHTVDPANNDIWEVIKNLYPKLDIVYVRETLSLNKLKEHGVNNVIFVPDALFGYHPKQEWVPTKVIQQQIDFSKPYICIGDSSGIKNGYNQVKWDIVSVYKGLIIELKEITSQIIFIDGFSGANKEINKVIKKTKVGYVNLKNCSYHDLYYVLKGADIFISGRWHASILSVLAGTPILLWGSDSHKTRSLYTLLDYPYPFYEVDTLPIHISDMVESVKSILRNKKKVQALLNDKLSVLSPRVKENVSFLKDILKNV